MSERIATKCPACHNSTLVIGGGNWLVCSLIGCPDPTRINSVGDRADSHFDDVQTLRDERDRLAKALKALVNEVGSYTVERQYYSREEASKDLDRREKALLAQLQQAKAALTPAEGQQREVK